MIITILEIPVPIPNTEVKQNSAKDTCGLPCWENRLLLDLIYSSLAQLVERPAVNRQVVGSSPTRGANIILTCNPKDLQSQGIVSFFIAPNLYKNRVIICVLLMYCLQ